jgi:hypothetical protein
LDANTSKKIRSFVLAHGAEVGTPPPTAEKCAGIVIDFKENWELLKAAIERKDWKSSGNIMDCIEEVEVVFFHYKNECVPVGERPTNDLLKIWPSFADFRFHFNLDAFNTAWYQVVPDEWLAEKMEALKKEMSVISNALDKITVSDF